MSNPLDSIYSAYITARDAVKVVRRCANLASIDQERPFRRTTFHRMPNAKVNRILDDTGGELEDLTVLSLYAAFERLLVQYLINQAPLLRADPLAPDFGNALSTWYSQQVNRIPMKAVERMFAPPVNETLLGRVGQIRTYRDWVAHGRKSPTPPSIVPKFAFDILTQFLRDAQLI